MLTSLRLTVSLLLAFGAVSCTGWPRGWNAAKRAHTAEGPGGAWIGTWKSQSTGHTGRLRCAVFPVKPPGAAALPPSPNLALNAKTAPVSASPPATNGQVWEYRYRASWARILCAGFTVDCLALQKKDGSWTVTGSRDLGPVFGGIFTHQATVDGNHLEAQYQSSADKGTLSLRRIGN